MTKKTRDHLKTAFEDNAVPTGEDFANLIESGLNQLDDQVYLLNQNLGVGNSSPAARLDILSDGETTTCIVKSSDASDPSLFVGGDGKVAVGHTTPSVDLDIQGNTSITGKVSISGQTDIETHTQGFNVTTNAMPSLHIDSQGYVGIGNQAPTKKLDVSGETQTDALSVQDRVAIDPSQADVLIHVKNNTENQAALRVESALGDTQVLVDDQGRLGIGVDSLQAGLHLQVNNESDVLRIDDQISDTTPLIINKDGQVGVGLENPTNKLDVAGNMVVGRSYAGVEGAPSDGLLVERKLGVGTIEPQAQLHINTTNSDEEPHLKLSTDNAPWLQADDSLLCVQVDTVLSDLQVTGDAQFDQDTTTTGNSLIQGDLDVSGLAKAGGLEILEDAQIHGKLAAYKDLLVLGQTTLKDQVVCEQGLQVNLETQFNSSADLVGNLHAHSDVAIDQNLTVQGESQLKDTVHLDAQAQPALRLPNADPEISDSVTLTGEGDLGLNVEAPQSTLHIKSKDAQAALQIDAGQQMAAVHVDAQGFIGFGTKAAQYPVDVRVDARFSEHVGMDADLDVSGAVNVQGKLSVANDVDVVGSTYVHTDLKVDANLNVGQQGRFQRDVKIMHSEFDPLSIEGDGEHADKLRVSQQGAVGINTNTPSAQLHVQSQPEQAALHVKTDAEKPASIHVDAQGFVGVNNDAPAYPLDVHGEAYFSDLVRIDSGLVVDKNILVTQDLKVFTNTYLNNKLEVTGESTFVGPVFIDNTLVVKESTHAQSNLLVDGELHVNAPSHLNAGAHIHSEISEQPALVTTGDAHFIGQTLVEGSARFQDSTHTQGDAFFENKVNAFGKVHATAGLQVTQDAQFDDSVLIAKNLETQGSASFDEDVVIEGPLDVQGPTQLHGPATLLDLGEQPSLHVLGESVFQKDIIVEDDAHLHAELHVRGPSFFEQDLRAESGVSIAQTLDVQGEAHFQAPVQFNSEIKAKAPANFEDSVSIQGPLHNLGPTSLNTLTVQPQQEDAPAIQAFGVTQLMGTLDVDAKTRLMDDLEVVGNSDFQGETLVSGPLEVENESAFNDKAMFNEALISKKSAYFEHSVDVMGHVEVDGSIHAKHAEISETLQVSGVGRFEKDVRINQHLQVDHYITVSDDLTVNGHVQFAQGNPVHSVDGDPYLGDEDSSDHKLVTQKAIKHYVDQYASAFSRGRNTVVINTQKDFESIFGDGGPKRLLEPEQTILLLPRKERNPQPGQTQNYILKNAVRLGTKTQIIGFNAASTRVQKDRAECRFEIVSETSNPISDVLLEGWTFDGTSVQQNQHFVGNGGAFYLSDAVRCTLNCHMVNHQVIGNGGAIFGQYTDDIEAKYIRDCQAIAVQPRDKNSGLGGAACGLNHACISAQNCHAERGGAVAQCNDSRVSAQRCDALYGGGAYLCNRLRLEASHCSAFRKGGGACFCDSLSCEGYWTGNSAMGQTTHVYTDENIDEGHQSKIHAWRGAYVGQRLINIDWRYDSI